VNKHEHHFSVFSVIVGCIVLAGSLAVTDAAERPATFCNPLDLDYRFQLDNPVRREAADPAIVFFKGQYWLFASKSGDAYQYYVEASRDGVKWKKILDRSDNHRDATHDYTELERSVKARHVRLVNVHCPAGADLSVSGLRIFGNGMGKSPGAVKNIVAQRNPADGRKAVISWSPSARAEFYIVRYGIAPDRLFGNYQIYNATTAQINSLTDGVTYYFSVDAVNDSGVTAGTKCFRLNP
jgi:hypothetical protein